MENVRYQVNSRLCDFGQNLSEDKIIYLPACLGPDGLRNELSVSEPEQESRGFAKCQSFQFTADWHLPERRAGGDICILSALILGNTYFLATRGARRNVAAGIVAVTRIFPYRYGSLYSSWFDSWIQ